MNEIRMPIKLVYLVFLSFLFSNSLLGQSPTYIHYEPEIDIPFSTTYGDIIQDSLGYIWFGTDSGLYRYDGESFDKIPTSSAINDIEVFDLKKDSLGTLWYITLTGHLCYYSKETDSVLIFNPDHFMDNLKVKSYQIQKNKIYFQVKGEKKFTVYSINYERDIAEDISHVYSGPGLNIYGYDKQNLIVTRGDGPKHGYLDLYSIKDKKRLYQIPFSQYGSSYKFIYNQNTILLIYEKTGKSYYMFANNQFTKIEIPLDITLMNNWYFSKNNFYFATNNGCYKLDTNFNIVDKNPILKGHNIFNILIDREGGKWLGAQDEGLYYFPPNQLSNYANNQLLSSATIRDITCLDNSIYIITSSNNAIFLHKNNLSPLSNHVTINRTIFDVQVAKNKFWLKTTDSLYTYSFSPSQNKAILSNNRRAEGKKVVLLNSNQFVTGGAMFLKLFNQSNIGDVLLSQRTTDIYHNKAESTIWVGGLEYPSRWIYSDSSQIKPIPITKVSGYITMINQDANHHTWFSTASKGLYEYADDIVFHYPLPDTHSKKINCFTISKSKIWLSSYNELFYFDRKTKRYHYTSSLKNLIKSPITTLYNHNDTLIIGTKKGLFLYSPKNAPNPTAPFINIKSISINSKDTTLLPSYNLTYSQNTVHIKFNSIGSYNPLNQPFIYYKINKDGKWYQAIEKQIYLSNLSSGQYNITAKSIYDINDKNYNSVTLTLIVAKPFWQQWWFRLLPILTISLLLYWWFNNKKKQLLQEKESEKLKNAVLQLQLNPHFIFNSMNTIIYYITVANKEKSIQILTKMSRLIRQIFNFSNKDLILLPTELGFLNDYLDMEKERFSEKVQINTNINPLAYESSIKIPPLMVQPILENSFKHGLLHKKNNGILNFTVQVHSTGVTFIIEDNGVGRPKSTIRKKDKISSYNVIGNRIKLINESKGEFSKMSVHFDIEDLFDTNHDPIGTKSTLVFEINS